MKFVDDLRIIGTIANPNSFKSAISFLPTAPTGMWDNTVLAAIYAPNPPIPPIFKNASLAPIFTSGETLYIRKMQFYPADGFSLLWYVPYNIFVVDSAGTPLASIFQDGLVPGEIDTQIDVLMNGIIPGKPPWGGIAGDFSLAFTLSDPVFSPIIFRPKAGRNFVNLNTLILPVYAVWQVQTNSGQGIFNIVTNTVEPALSYNTAPIVVYLSVLPSSPFYREILLTYVLAGAVWTPKLTICGDVADAYADYTLYPAIPDPAGPPAGLPPSLPMQWINNMGGIVWLPQQFATWGALVIASPAFFLSQQAVEACGDKYSLVPDKIGVTQYADLVLTVEHNFPLT
jgi:hypothetical protein